MLEFYEVFLSLDFVSTYRNLVKHSNVAFKYSKNQAKSKKENRDYTQIVAFLSRVQCSF